MVAESTMLWSLQSLEGTFTQAASGEGQKHNWKPLQTDAEADADSRVLSRHRHRQAQTDAEAEADRNRNRLEADRRP